MVIFFDSNLENFFLLTAQGNKHIIRVHISSIWWVQAVGALRVIGGSRVRRGREVEGVEGLEGVGAREGWRVVEAL